MAGFAPASLPFFEATVYSVLFGVWRAWQLTKCLAKALSLSVCCVPPHKFLNNFYDSFDINNHLRCLHHLATRFLLIYRKRNCKLTINLSARFLLGRGKSQHCLMTVVVTSYRRGALVTPTLTRVPKMQGSRALT